MRPDRFVRGPFVPAFLMILGLLVGSSSGVASENHVITASGMSFSQPALTLDVGDSVTWLNVSGTHNVVADDNSFRCALGCDGAGGDGDPSDAAWQFTLVFRTEADIAYYCEIHGGPDGFGMAGTLSVEGIFGDGFESGDMSFWAP